MLADDSAAGRKGDPAAGSVGPDTEVQGDDCSEDPTSRDLVAVQSRPALLNAASNRRPQASALISLFAAVCPDQTKDHDALEYLRAIVGERVLREIRMFQERVDAQFQTFPERVEEQLGYLREDVNTQSTVLQECVDGQVAALHEHFDAQFTALREHLDAQFTALREHLDAQFIALREHVVTQFTELREVMDARFDAQDSKLDALGAEIQSLRRESRLTFALVVILVALRLF